MAAAPLRQRLPYSRGRPPYGKGSAAATLLLLRPEQGEGDSEGERKVEAARSSLWSPDSRGRRLTVVAPASFRGGGFLREKRRILGEN